MSKKCPECGSLNIDYLFEENESWCNDCGLHFPTSDVATASLFDKITESEEKLAEKLVYAIRQMVTIPSTSIENPGGYEIKTKWYSMIVADDFDSESEAIAATIEELKKEAKDEK